ncbi:MAG: PD-(D/E)XK nuclease family protein [Muribaculaceae bacterium]|nr:PD-(D/E)XK nuclease family protein [Muribaculaceae bacterium]
MFLTQIAQHYLSRENLEDYCFVFPNNRSAQFFAKTLQERATSTLLMPNIQSITDFLFDLTDRVPITPLEGLIVLYQEYSKLFGDQAAGIERFMFWGNVILNDFNDIDKNLVDAKKLYTNVSDLRHISTDYLDDDLRREISRIFNVEGSNATKTERFWKHASSENHEGVERDYFDLWERLNQLYDNFHATLTERGQATLGMIHRLAVNSVRDSVPFGFDKVVFVGFGWLTVSEQQLFKLLQQRGVAEFWWDDVSPYMDDEANSGGRFIHSLHRQFPMPKDLDLASVQAGTQRITAVEVPGFTAQAKWAFQPVLNMIQSGDIKVDENTGNIVAADAIKTAVIVPDESLLIPLLNSVPEQVKALNVTMGYSLRNSAIVSLVHIIARAHRQATHNQRDGQWYYYREDVKDILSHPLVKSAFTTDVLHLNNAIDESNTFNIAQQAFAGTALEQVMLPLADTRSTADVLAFIKRLRDFALKIGGTVPAPNADNAAPDQDVITLSLTEAFTTQYADVLEQIAQLIVDYDLPLGDDSVFYLIDRLSSSGSIPFTGEPLEGLQIMGVLEARCLDFDHVIILSANEGTYPARSVASSFIPADLRRASLMPCSAEQEAEATYQFYRLITRARTVTMIYNGQDTAAASGEPSHFIEQLQKLYKCPVTRLIAQATVNAAQSLTIEVEKTGAMVDGYLQPRSGVELSASSINEYLSCQLRFYLHHIEHLDNDSDTSEFMDNGTFGTIVHDTLQELYYPNVDGQEREGTYRVSKEMIEEFEKNRMRQAIARNINKTYLCIANHDAPLEGEAYIESETIATFVRNVLRYDIQLLERSADKYFEIVECEKTHHVVVDADGTKFNFQFKPDRVDRIDGRLRIVDYKTGGDKTDFKDLSECFDSQASYSNRRHAVLQLLLYCNAWWSEPGAQQEVIEPVIYKIKEMEETGVTKSGSQVLLERTGELNQEFLKQMGTLVKELTSHEATMTQHAKNDNCKYCNFVDICRRDVPSY